MGPAMHINVKNEIGPCLQSDDVGVDCPFKWDFFRGGGSDEALLSINFCHKIVTVIVNVKIFEFYSWKSFLKSFGLIWDSGVIFYYIALFHSIILYEKQ